MKTYQTPGVYTEEISTLPPSVAGVSTAIPAFIGHTESGRENDLEMVPTKITTLLEFKALFGEAAKAKFSVEVGDDNIEVKIEEEPKHLFYHHLSMYFQNGGGPCYIVSVGSDADNLTKGDETSGIIGGLRALEKEDEPTLIVIPDAVMLAADNLAATDLTKLNPKERTETVKKAATDYHSVCQEVLKQCGTLKDRFAIFDVFAEDKDGSLFRDGIGTEYLKYGAAYFPYLQTSLSYYYDKEKEEDVKITGLSSNANIPGDLAAAKTKDTALYNQIKRKLAEKYVSLPPSAAIAGIYAKVDRERGVWKAPANVSLASVIGPNMEITQEEQDKFNIDADSGKSINIIRKFHGKGTLVWGARTLAGNDNEWRYISVRRLFNMIEESTQKATSFAVFESNNALTWLKVRAMIESYLYGLWEQGALAGAAPEQAYYVQVGLGKTMTTQDVLEGRMNVEIGIAAVRPAEFIVLKFSHKLQEA